MSHYASTVWLLSTTERGNQSAEQWNNTSKVFPLGWILKICLWQATWPMFRKWWTLPEGRPACPCSSKNNLSSTIASVHSPAMSLFGADTKSTLHVMITLPLSFKYCYTTIEGVITIIRWIYQRLQFMLKFKHVNYNLFDRFLRNN